MSEKFKVNTLISQDKVQIETKLEGDIKFTSTKSNFSPEDLYNKQNSWHEFENVVCVAFDLEKSTNMNTQVGQDNMPKIYDAAMSVAVDIFNAFETDFVSIQGDGGFALFWGERKYEKAICAAITLQTINSKYLMPSIRNKYPVESEGFRIGVADGFLNAKNVASPNRKHYDQTWSTPVWSGKSVNFAHKVVQKAEPNSLRLLKSVYENIEDNELLTHSCGCDSSGATNVGIGFLWEKDPQLIETIPKRYDSTTMILGRNWCERHADLFCELILQGQKKRPNGAY